MRASLGVLGCLLVAVGCRSHDVSLMASESASAEARPLATPLAPERRVGELRAAELTRRGAEFRDADGTDHAPEIRRAAARGLARLRDAAMRPRLLAALSDEDSEVVAWAAYGLGELCSSAREGTVSALVARGTGFVDATEETPLRAFAAIARALGRCATDAAEKTLLEWATGRGPQAAEAILGLGDVATQRGHLREETCVALLELASGSASTKPWSFALQPLTRTTSLPPSVIERAREVASLRLVDGGVDRVHALRTLGKTDEKAVAPLAAELVAVGKALPSERVEAARGLARLGAPGQRALRDALAALLQGAGDAEKAEALRGADFGPLLTALELLTDSTGARAMLERYARLDVAKDAAPTLVRRASQLRCTAARLVAERDFEYPRLTRCDLSAPEGAEGAGPIGGRAMVAAIGIEGTKLVAKRLRVWKRYAEGTDALARADAIRLIGAHPELEDPETPLGAALESKIGGVVAAAAEVIAQHPDRIRRRDEGPLLRGKADKNRKARSGDARVGKALVALLESVDATSDLEVTAHVIDAAGALLLDAAREPLGRLCASPHGVLRHHAERALATLLGGDQKVTCPQPEGGLPAPEELARLGTGSVKLVFESDAGELGLELDPAYAPAAVARVVGLTTSGFYDGIVVHRVVPGFVTQLGSPTADGFGGAPGKPPLPCETSPLPFRAGTVGMALAGRDTGSSQFFVTHGDFPHLDGQYAWLGTSTGPWSSLVEGDRIVRARVAP